MTVFSEILGNINTNEWLRKTEGFTVESIILDQWTAQKSRFLATSDHGIEYPIALRRQSRITDGDIVAFDPDAKKVVILRLGLNPVLEIDLGELATLDPGEIIRHAVELGHAIGNQHWPAVVKGTKVYVPLTVDKKVMMSVMETHDIPHVYYNFHEAAEVIPYMAPHEIRRLFGGASHESHSHAHQP